MQTKVRRSMTSSADLELHEQEQGLCSGVSMPPPDAVMPEVQRVIKLTTCGMCAHVQLKELKEAVGHDPDQKHVDTFKQAAHIWAELPKEEKDRINAEFRVRPQHPVVYLPPCLPVL
jgi:hypothetical protein